MQTAAWLNPSGMTVETRFIPPAGYTRVDYNDDYVKYMRNLPMLPDGAPVKIFTGSLKESQNDHVGVLNIDVGTRDLQQCSDAAQRLRAEYLYGSGKQDKIMFHLTNGQELAWSKWRAGWRLKFEGRKTSLVKSAKPSSNYQTFRNYLDTVFMYASVQSVMKESPVITIRDLKPGDAIAGTGHLIIVLDVVEDINHHKKFLLAQSYIPAQEIEVLKNPYDQSTPWYDESYLESCPFYTPEWVYDCPGPTLYRLL